MKTRILWTVALLGVLAFVPDSAGGETADGGATPQGRSLTADQQTLPSIDAFLQWEAQNPSSAPVQLGAKPGGSLRESGQGSVGDECFGEWWLFVCSNGQQRVYCGGETDAMIACFSFCGGPCVRV